MNITCTLHYLTIYWSYIKKSIDIFAVFAGVFVRVKPKIRSGSAFSMAFSQHWRTVGLTLLAIEIIANGNKMRVCWNPLLHKLKNINIVILFIWSFFSSILYDARYYKGLMSPWHYILKAWQAMCRYHLLSVDIRYPINFARVYKLSKKLYWFKHILLNNSAEQKNFFFDIDLIIYIQYICAIIL